MCSGKKEDNNEVSNHLYIMYNHTVNHYIFLFTVQTSTSISLNTSHAYFPGLPLETYGVEPPSNDYTYEERTTMMQCYPTNDKNKVK